MKSTPFVALGLLSLLGIGAVALATPHTHESADLRTIMVDLGQQMARAQSALWVDDLETVAAAAHEIAHHPHVAADERARIQGILGEEMVSFAAADRVVHDGAVRLAEAAQGGDMDAVLREFGAVQTGCVACHTEFRARLSAPRE